jgi:hypothetical protein
MVLVIPELALAVCGCQILRVRKQALMRKARVEFKDLPREFADRRVPRSLFQPRPDTFCPRYS